MSAHSIALNIDCLYNYVPYSRKISGGEKFRVFQGQSSYM